MIASMWYPAADFPLHPLYVGVVHGLVSWGIRP